MTLPRDVVDALRVPGRDPAKYRQRRLPTEVHLEAAAVLRCSRGMRGAAPGVGQHGAAAGLPATNPGGATTGPGAWTHTPLLPPRRRGMLRPRAACWRVSGHPARNRFMHRRRPRKFRLTRSRQRSSNICFSSCSRACRPFTAKHLLLPCSSSCSCRSFFLQVVPSCACLKILNIVLLSERLHLLFSFDNRFELSGIQNSRC